MKVKPLLFLVLIVMMLQLGFCSSALGLNYEMGLKEDERIIWSCNVCDKNKMIDLFGSKWQERGDGFFKDLAEGTKLKWIIKSVDEDKKYSEETEQNEKSFTVKYDIWRWTNDEKWGSKDSTEQQDAFVNPNHYTKGYIYPDFAPIWLPTPVGEYMKTLEPVLYKGYTVDGRVLLSFTCELEKQKISEKYPTEDIKILAMYTEEGILRTYKLYISDHIVIIDISLDEPPDFNIVLTILLAGVLILGTIYVIFKLVN